MERRSVGTSFWHGCQVGPELVQSKRSKVISDKFAKKMLKRREESMLFTRRITREGVYDKSMIMSGVFEHG